MIELFAIILAIIAATKFLIASGNKTIDLGQLVSVLSIKTDLANLIVRAIVVFDGLLELICVILIISII